MIKEVNICEKLLFGFERSRVESLLDLAPSASFKKQMHGLHPLANLLYPHIIASYGYMQITYVPTFSYILNIHD